MSREATSRSRTARRVAVVAAVSFAGVVASPVAALASSGPLAAIGDHQPGWGASAAYLGLVLGLVPVGVVIIVALLTLRSPRAHGGLRYRPGRPWAAPTAWFGEVDDDPAVDPDHPRMAVPGMGGARGRW